MVFSPFSRLISSAASSASQRPFFALLKRASARKWAEAPFSDIFRIPPCLRSLYSPCFAEGQSTSDHQFSASFFFARLDTTCSSSESLPSLGSNTLALGSCLCDNKSKTRQRQAVVLSQKPPRKPCDLCVLRVSASLFRTFSHHMHKLRVSEPPKNHTTCAPRFAEGWSASDKSVYVMHETPKGRCDAEDAADEIRRDSKKQWPHI